jgi:universal stress protein A
MRAQFPGGDRSGGFHRILCPTDFTSLAETGVDRAAALAAREGAELVLVHVLAPLTTYVVPEMAGSVLIGFEGQWREEAREQLRRLRDRVRVSGVPTHTVLVQGYAPDQIARAAQRLRCDLIVLATHGRTGLSRLLLGSVAEALIRRAPCPVLAFRPPQPARARREAVGHLKAAA